MALQGRSAVTPLHRYTCVRCPCVSGAPRAAAPRPTIFPPRDSMYGRGRPGGPLLRCYAVTRVSNTTTFFARQAPLSYRHPDDYFPAAREKAVGWSCVTP